MKYHIACPIQTPEHKKDFEGAYWSHLVGIKGRVVIDAAEEHKKERLA